MATATKAKTANRTVYEVALIDAGTRLVRVEALLTELNKRLGDSGDVCVVVEALCDAAENEVEQLLDEIFERAQPEDRKALRVLRSR